MSAVRTIAILGRDAPLWLAGAALRRALAPAGVAVTAVALPGEVGAADIHPTLPAIEALHNQIGVDEAALLRATRGAFTLGQNFGDTTGAGAPAFLHAYGGAGTAIDGSDFFAHWLKARRLGLGVGIEDFSLTATAARHGRLMLPDEESERYARSDYGYHLPAAAYARALRAIALHLGVEEHAATAIGIEHRADGGVAAVLTGDGRRVEADLFVDATREGALISDAMGIAQTGGDAGWDGDGGFAADRMLIASGPRFASVPVYAEIRASGHGWTGLFPTQERTHAIHAYRSDLIGDEAALEAARTASGLALEAETVRRIAPGRRSRAWTHNVVAIGDAACTLDAVHSTGLHMVQLGIVQLLACFPAGEHYDAQRAEYDRISKAAAMRVREFQSAHYALARYAGPFWDAARAAPLSEALAHAIALFRARGEVAPYEDESLPPDSWRALFVGHGVMPDSWLPSIDRTPPDAVKAHFRRMLGFVRDQVLRQPTHDEYLARIGQRPNG